MENDKNLKIMDSYLIKDVKKMEEIIGIAIVKGFKTDRSMTSMVNEWKAHNLLYNLHIARSHTKDVDIESSISKKLDFIYKILGGMF